MNNNEITISSQSLEDDTLYNMVRATMNRDYKSLVEWLIEYHYGKPEEWDRFELEARHVSQELSSLIKAFKKKLRWSLLEEGDALFNGTIKKLLTSFWTKNKKIINHISSLHTVIAHLCETMKVKDENDLKTVLQYLEKLYQHVFTLNGSELYNNSVMTYEKELTDHIFLIKELIFVFTDEYNKEVMKTKERFEQSVCMHEKEVEDIQKELDSVNSKIGSLGNDTAVSEKDRKTFLSAFEEKKAALTSLLEKAENRMSGINSLLKEVIESYSTIKSFIDSLKEQLRSFKAREHYLESLYDVGKKIPEFEERMGKLFDVSTTEVKELQRSFIIFNSDLQDHIIKAIEDQETINRIVFSDKDSITEEFNLLKHEKKQDMSGLTEIRVDDEGK